MKANAGKSKQLKIKTIVLAVNAAIVLQACSVQPTYLNNDERRVIFDADKARVRQQVVPLIGELSMSEAVARGLKYNTDYRIRMMEQSIALGALDLSKFDLLPKVLADAGYITRDRPNISKAINSVTGEPSLSDPYISSDQTYRTSGLMLNWSVLDFGMSYVNAKQNADRVLIAGERRKKAMHLLVQDIQVAYIRAAGAQRMRTELIETLMLADQALADSRQVEKENLKQPLEALRYQKSLLDNLRLLEQIESELTAAKTELAQLINLPANSIRLASPDEILLPSGFKEANIENLEILALMNNTDLQESVYSARIAAQESKKALIKIIPNISFTYGPQYTNNSYTINQNWLEGSAKLSLNLGNLLTAPMALDQAKAEKELAAEKRAAMQMSVMTQVHLTKQQLENSRRLYARATQISGVDNRIARITMDREREGVASKAELVATKATAILSKLREYQSMAQIYAANGQMLATLGMQPVLGSLDDLSLSDLTNNISQIHRDWSQGVLPQLKEIEKNSIKTADLANESSNTLSEVKVTEPSISSSVEERVNPEAINVAKDSNVLTKKEKARLAKEERARKAAENKTKKLAEEKELKEQTAQEKAKTEAKQKSLTKEDATSLAQEKERAKLVAKQKEQARLAAEQKAQQKAELARLKEQQSIAQAEVAAKENALKEARAKEMAEEAERNRLVQEEKKRLLAEQKAQQEKLAREKRAQKLAEDQKLKEQQLLDQAEAQAREKNQKEQQAKLHAEEKERAALARTEKNLAIQLEREAQAKLLEVKKAEDLAVREMIKAQKELEAAEVLKKELAQKEERAKLVAQQKEQVRLAAEQKAQKEAEAQRLKTANEEKVLLENEMRSRQLAEKNRIQEQQANEKALVKNQSDNDPAQSVAQERAKSLVVSNGNESKLDSTHILFANTELETQLMSNQDLKLYVHSWFDALQKKDTKAFISKYVPGNRALAKQAFISKNSSPQSIQITEVNELAKDTYRIGIELLEPGKTAKNYLYLDKKSGSYQARFHYNDLIEHVNVLDKQLLPEEKLSQLDQMVKQWGQARNAGNKDELVKLYAPDDQDIVKSNLRDFRASDSEVEITGIKTFSQERFLLRVKRSWPGKKSGEANIPLAIQFKDGQWLFRSSELRMMNQ